MRNEIITYKEVYLPVLHFSMEVLPGFDVQRARDINGIHVNIMGGTIGIYRFRHIRFLIHNKGRTAVFIKAVIILFTGNC